jgi:D-3-phosphoglycerate dehydrogenase
VHDNVENLILDLLEWAGRTERTYQETMEAWRTSCPRLPVWEEANDRGLLEVGCANGCSTVRLTAAGYALLSEKDRTATSHASVKAKKNPAPPAAFGTDS